MLGKLIKHEFKGSGRTMVPFILVCLGLSVLAGLSIRGMENLQDYGWFTVLFGIVMFLFAAGLIAVCIMALVVCIERFRKNLLGDEGYLMFTLPVSVDEHIFAKLIVSSVWFVATWLVCMLAFVLMFLCNLDLMDVDWSEISYVMGEVWAKLLDFGLLHIIAYTLFAIHMLAGVECVHYYLEMRIQRRCHYNGIDCLVVEQPAVVLVSLCVRSYGFGRVERRLVNVGQCHYVGLGILCQETHKKLTARARPYYAEAAAFLACFPHL